MPLELHQGLRNRLIELLNENLPVVKVVGNKYVDYKSIEWLTSLDDALPTHGPSPKAALEAYVGESPVSVFIASELARELDARQYDGNATFDLTTLPAFADTALASIRLVDSLESLPWEYSGLIALAPSLGDLLAESMPEPQYELSPRISLFRVPADGGGFPLQTEPVMPGLFALLGTTPRPNGVNPHSTYIRGLLRGYLPRYGTSTPVEDYFLTVRAICGLLFAFRLVEHDRSVLRSRATRYALLYGGDAGARVPHEAQELPAEFGAAVAAQTLPEGLQEKRPEFSMGLAKRCLDKLATVLRGEDQNDRIIRAAAWLFDSEAGNNRHLSFVQAAVSLEILFGDKAVSDIIGLGELLANRCAYLIGTSRTQRAEVLADFRRAYATRSRIVHSGHHRLTRQDRQDLYTLQWMAGRSLQEEVKLLGADSS